MEIDEKYPEVSLFYNLEDRIKITTYEKKVYYNFFEGGYSIIKSDNSLLIFDYGELGYGELAAHGHADALMFLYSYRGNKFFCDSGTYIYNIKSKERDYYRSTFSHSTLVYMKQSQSEMKGPFLWGK